MAALADIADLIMGQSPPSPTYNEAGNGLAFFQGKTDFGFRHPMPKLYCSAPIKIAKPNDILISVRAPVGPTNIADRECCIGRGLAAIHPRDIDGDFLFFNLRYIEKYIASLGSGSTFHAINKSQLASVEVNSYQFGLSEQRKIAGVLGVVERAIEQQERLLALTAELKKALLHKLFTEGLRGEPQKETEIGPVPESWEIAKLGSVMNLQTGKLNSNAATPDGAFPFFTCSQETFRINHYAFDTEAILLSGNNAQGIYSVKHYKGKFNAYQRTYVITLRDDNSIPYSFLHQALSRNLDRLRTLSIGTSTKYLTKAVIQNLLIPKPKYEEAQEIGQQLQLLEKKGENTAKRKRFLEELFRTLLHQLMTAQLRVDRLDLSEIGERTQ